MISVIRRAYASGVYITEEKMGRGDCASLEGDLVSKLARCLVAEVIQEVAEA